MGRHSRVFEVPCFTECSERRPLAFRCCTVRFVGFALARSVLCWVGEDGFGLHQSLGSWSSLQRCFTPRLARFATGRDTAEGDTVRRRSHGFDLVEGIGSVLAGNSPLGNVH